MTQRLGTILLLCGLTAGAAAGQDKAGVVGTRPGEVVRGNTAFALDLFKQVGCKSENVVLSPYGVSAALAVPYAGSRGETARQMRTALHFPFGPRHLGSAFGPLLAPDGDKARSVEFRSATSLWVARGVALDKDFEAAVGADYRTRVRVADFAADPAAAGRAINAWAADETRQRVRELVAPGGLARDTRALVASAVYLKAAWHYPFPKDDTRKAEFRVGPAKTVGVSLITLTEDLEYAEDETAQAVGLPYQGGEFVMVVLLPRKPGGLPTVEKDLTPEALERWTARLKERRVEVSLPRFRLDAEFDLTPAVADLGMADAFSDRADFTRMTPGGQFALGPIVHKTSISVDETGTEAAAATASGLVPSWVGGGRDKVVFRADHPFLFLIQERKTGSIVFLGRVAVP